MSVRRRPKKAEHTENWESLLMLSRLPESTRGVIRPLG